MGEVQGDALGLKVLLLRAAGWGRAEVSWVQLLAGGKGCTVEIKQPGGG